MTWSPPGKPQPIAPAPITPVPARDSASTSRSSSNSSTPTSASTRQRIGRSLRIAHPLTSPTLSGRSLRSSASGNVNQRRATDPFALLFPTSSAVGATDPGRPPISNISHCRGDRSGRPPVSNNSAVGTTDPFALPSPFDTPFRKQRQPRSPSRLQPRGVDRKHSTYLALGGNNVFVSFVPLTAESPSRLQHFRQERPPRSPSHFQHLPP